MPKGNAKNSGSCDPTEPDNDDKIMPQLRVIAFDAERLALSRCDCMLAWIQQLSIRRKAVTEIPMRGRRVIDDLLHRVPVSFPNYAEAQNAATVSVYAR